MREAQHRPRRLLRLLAGRGRRGQRAARACCRPSCARSAARASWRWPRRCRPRKLQRRVGATMQVLVDSRAGAGPQGRRRPQLCRRARDRRHGAPAAAGEGVEDAEGRRVHARAHRRPPKATTWSADADLSRTQPDAIEPKPPPSSTSLIHHPYQPPAGFGAVPAGGAQGLDGALRRTSPRCARATGRSKSRLHLRPARHADHLHARGAHRHARRRRCRRCWCPAAWRRSRWSTSRC